MASAKRLNSVCHSIAHHAVSGLSFIHPHLRLACKSAGIDRITIELLSENPYPQNLKHLQPLALALLALREKFITILNAEGFDITHIQSVTLQFQFQLLVDDDYSTNCLAKITSKYGKTYQQFVDALGFKIKCEILNTDA